MKQSRPREIIFSRISRRSSSPAGGSATLARLGCIHGYLEILVEIAEASGGGVLEPDVRVSDASDHEDNRILELALAANADVIFSDDADLTSLSPWRGIPVLQPRAFAGRVDAARRARRRPPR